MAQETVLINGTEYDFSGCRLNVFGQKIVGFTSIDYDDKVERGEARGASMVALGSSRGKYTAEPCKITMLKSSSDALRQSIAAQSRTGNSLGQVEGTIVLQFVHVDIGVQTITMSHCKVNKPGTSSSKEGPDPLTEEWEFYVRFLDRNGITLFESDEAGAT